MIPRLFVYGTLRPGQQRWPAIEFFVARSEPATLSGFTLYDLPAGYPAIEPGDGTVVGTLLHLEAERVEEAISKADAIEGYREGDGQSLYERVEVEVAGVSAYTYVYHPNRQADLRERGRLVEGGDWVGGE